jgi:hypothetical protein
MFMVLGIFELYDVSVSRSASVIRCKRGYDHIHAR